MWECPLKHGRTAFIPESNILVSAIKQTKENSSDMIVLKTITCAALVGEMDEDEEEVLSITAKHDAEDGSMLYETTFTSGTKQWLPASSFINDDGTATFAWLAYASEEEIQGAYQRFTLENLKVYHLKFDIFQKRVLGNVHYVETEIEWGETEGA